MNHHDPKPRQYLKHVLATLMGHKVTIKTSDNSYSGILVEAYPLSPSRRVVLSYSSESAKVVQIPFESIHSIVSDSPISLKSFGTDKQISQYSSNTRRNLQKWSDEPVDPSLDSSKVFNANAQNWDQFKSSKHPSTYHEHNYTTKVDTSHPKYHEFKKEAEQIEREITKSKRPVTFSADNEFDEEVRFSAARPISSDQEVAKATLLRSHSPKLNGPKVLERNHQIPGIQSAPTSPLPFDHPTIVEEANRANRSGSIAAQRRPSFTQKEYVQIREVMGRRRSTTQLTSVQLTALQCQVASPSLSPEVKQNFDLFKAQKAKNDMERRKREIAELKQFHTQFKYEVVDGVPLSNMAKPRSRSNSISGDRKMSVARSSQLKKL
ncbi:hypothetical protein GEMRC1_006273 [Eukaryota sp. GEM-RC1]